MVWIFVAARARGNASETKPLDSLTDAVGKLLEDCVIPWFVCMYRKLWLMTVNE